MTGTPTAPPADGPASDGATPGEPPAAGAVVAAPLAAGDAQDVPDAETPPDEPGASDEPDASDAEGFSWLLVDFAHRVPDVQHVLAVSADGLLMAMSSDLDRARADTVAAIVAGLTSLVRGASGHLAGGEVRQAVVEMDEVFLLVMSVSDGAVLAVVAGAACDVGLVGYEMALLASRAEAVLSPQLIDEARALLPTEGTAAAARPAS